MPHQRLRRPFRDHAPADRLTRAIRDIDRQIEAHRLADEPAPLSAYRARLILKEAHARCRERVESRAPFVPFLQAARPDVMPKPHRSRRDPVERYEALPGPHHSLAEGQETCLVPASEADLRFRRFTCGSHAYEGTTMAYDWTGETTRKRNRLKLATAVLLSLVIVLGIPAALSPFL